MTKRFLIFTCLSTVLLHGMEKEANAISLLGVTPTSLSLKCNKTNIHLTKEPLLAVTNKVNCTIVGNNQQALLSGKFYNDTVGTIMYCPYRKNIPHPHYGTISIEDPHVYVKNSDDDSSSEDDTYKPYPYNPEDTKEKLWEGVFTKITSDTKIITEPCINTLYGEFVYNVRKKNPNYRTQFMGYGRDGAGISIDWGQQKEDILLQFAGDKAIQEASNDLSKCYREILRIMAGYYSSVNNPEARYTRPRPEPNINIAIPTLSTDVGFPRDKAAPIAIAAILNFLQEYTEGYDNIYLVVKKRSDFKLYKKLLMEYYKPTDVIYLLYWMHKDAEQDISCLPKDMINYIVRFMYNS